MSLKISYIVPVYKAEKTLGKCLDHLIDQDYKDAEIVCVIDGMPQSKGMIDEVKGLMIEDFIKKHKKMGRKAALKKAKKEISNEDAKAEIRAGAVLAKHEYKEIIKKRSKKGIEIKVVHFDENKGAPEARNRGAEIATGDILWFMDSDTYLLPGMARLHIEAFEDNPKCDFVYGDYQILNGDVVRGRKWEPYALRAMNYISTMSPVRKDSFIGWDKSVKALQDWDMWLRMAKAGKQGHYLDRIVFETEPSEPGSITYCPPEDWLERFDAVHDKNDIFLSDTVVTSLGAMNHALHVAKTLDAEVHPYPSFKPHKYKKIILLGFYTAGGANAIKQHMGVFSNAPKAKRIIYWIGTDILMLYDRVPLNIIKKMVMEWEEQKVIHVCECENTKKELEFVGIKPKVIPIPPPKIYDVQPLPKKFSVGIYVNGTQPHMYFEPEMYDIIQSMPDVEFKVFGTGDHKAPEGSRNMKNIPHIDNMEQFIKETACILRVTRHDGLPLLPVEFVLMGRQAVVSLGDGQLHKEMKHMIPIRQLKSEQLWSQLKPKIIGGIREAQKKFEAGELNTAGHKYWSRHMDHDAFKDAINKL